MVDIKGLNKAKVLKALYDGSHVQGMGFLQAVPTFSLEDAENELRKNNYFDYLHGRIIKVDLSSDEGFDERLYDRDNYPGKAQAVIDVLRKAEGL